jgi:hypothetical protein
MKINILIEQNSTKNNSLNNSLFLANDEDNFVSGQFELNELGSVAEVGIGTGEKKFIQDIVLLETLNQLDLQQHQDFSILFFIEEFLSSQLKNSLWYYEIDQQNSRVFWSNSLTNKFQRECPFLEELQIYIDQ